MVEAIGRMRELGQLSRPPRAGPIEDHGDFVALLLTFGCEGQSVKDSPERFLRATLRIRTG